MLPVQSAFKTLFHIRDELSPNGILELVKTRKVKLVKKKWIGDITATVWICKACCLPFETFFFFTNVKTFFFFFLQKLTLPCLLLIIILWMIIKCRTCVTTVSHSTGSQAG